MIQTNLERGKNFLFDFIGVHNGEDVDKEKLRQNIRKNLLMVGYQPKG